MIVAINSESEDDIVEILAGWEVPADLREPVRCPTCGYLMEKRFGPVGYAWSCPTCAIQQ